MDCKPCFHLAASDWLRSLHWKLYIKDSDSDWWAKRGLKLEERIQQNSGFNCTVLAMQWCTVEVDCMIWCPKRTMILRCGIRGSMYGDGSFGLPDVARIRYPPTRREDKTQETANVVAKLASSPNLEGLKWRGANHPGNDGLRIIEVICTQRRMFRNPKYFPQGETRRGPTPHGHRLR